MIEFSITFFALAVPAVIFAGLSKGGFGSGAAFAATPLLALILDPGAAIGLMLPLLMLMDVTALRPYWRQWDNESALALIVGSVPGILIGTLLYSFADPDVFRFLIGVIAVGFVGFQGVKALGWIRKSERLLPRSAGWIAGAVAGFTSFISHAGGPPAAVYLLSRGLTKTGFQATTVIVFWAINLLKFIPYAALGIFSYHTFLAGLILAPVAVFGVWLGVKCHRALPERLFFALTYVFLIITGAKLIYDSLT
ncbi:sulfite exporter TauE/SafE family protein [Cochlodiniinecator piscidefendens]|uniref:sulfite exporter TauE/SafE family protein n=1 Tax=Cochlodiniinecator piscidefendens TaxID=2715756 RepID=UPI00140A858A